MDWIWQGDHHEFQGSQGWVRRWPGNVVQAHRCQKPQPCSRCDYRADFANDFPTESQAVGIANILAESVA